MSSQKRPEIVFWFLTKQRGTSRTHVTLDEERTLCGRQIPEGLDLWDDDLTFENDVECRTCDRLYKEGSYDN